MKTTTALLLGLCCAAPAQALACTLVQGHGWQGCVEAPERTPVWFDRWGAVATDPSNGAFGAADTVSERDRAIGKAMKRCKNDRGVRCEVRLVYRNACAAMVSGAAWDFFQSDPARDVAIATAMRKCEDKDSGCKLVYTRCSEGVSR